MAIYNVLVNNDLATLSLEGTQLTIKTNQLGLIYSATINDVPDGWFENTDNVIKLVQDKIVSYLYNNIPSGA